MFERIAPGTYALAAQLPSGLKHRGRGRPPMDLVRVLSPRAYPQRPSVVTRVPLAFPLSAAFRPPFQWVLSSRGRPALLPAANCILGSDTCTANVHCEFKGSITLHTNQGEPA